jgi:hypothetical protein
VVGRRRRSGRGREEQQGREDEVKRAELHFWIGLGSREGGGWTSLFRSEFRLTGDLLSRAFLRTTRKPSCS